jgi:hypothetical protein
MIIHLATPSRIRLQIKFLPGIHLRVSCHLIIKGMIWVGLTLLTWYWRSANAQSPIPNATHASLTWRCCRLPSVTSSIPMSSSRVARDLLFMVDQDLPSREGPHPRLSQGSPSRVASSSLTNLLSWISKSNKTKELRPGRQGRRYRQSKAAQSGLTSTWSRKQTPVMLRAPSTAFPRIWWTPNAILRVFMSNSLTRIKIVMLCGRSLTRRSKRASLPLKETSQVCTAVRRLMNAWFSKSRPHRRQRCNAILWRYMSPRSSLG